MKALLSRFKSNADGSSAAEFALVLPLLLIFLLGIIDVGRLLYTWNQAEKATQMGVRFAVVANVVATNLQSHDFTTDGVGTGDPVKTSVFKHAECVNGDCPRAQCVGTACSSFDSDLGYSATNFSKIVSWMNVFFPRIAADNVQIDYDSADVTSGGVAVNLGYVSDPSSLSLSPLVTVRIKNITFTPILFTIFGASITLPDFKATLPMEDGKGIYSN